MSFFVCGLPLFSCSSKAPTLLASTGEIHYCNMLSEIMTCFIDTRLMSDFDSCLNILDKAAEEVEAQLGDEEELDLEREQLSFNYQEQRDKRRFIEYRNDINQCKSSYRYQQGIKKMPFLKNCFMEASYDLDELFNCAL